MLPEPKVLWGAPVDLADKIGISERMLRYVIAGTRKTAKGWRYIKDPEEIEKYYQPPVPLPRHWQDVRPSSTVFKDCKMVLYKDWEKGQPAPKDPHSRFVGNINDLIRMTGWKMHDIIDLIRTYKGEKFKRRRHTLHGWRLYRITGMDTKKEPLPPKRKIQMLPKFRKIRREFKKQCVADYIKLNGELK